MWSCTITHRPSHCCITREKLPPAGPIGRRNCQLPDDQCCPRAQKPNLQLIKCQVSHGRAVGIPLSIPVQGRLPATRHLTAGTESQLVRLPVMIHEPFQISLIPGSYLLPEDLLNGVGRGNGRCLLLDRRDDLSFEAKCRRQTIRTPRTIALRNQALCSLIDSHRDDRPIRSTIRPSSAGQDARLRRVRTPVFGGSGRPSSAGQDARLRRVRTPVFGGNQDARLRRERTPPEARPTTGANDLAATNGSSDGDSRGSFTLVRLTNDLEFSTVGPAGHGPEPMATTACRELRPIAENRASYGRESLLLVRHVEEMVP